MQIVPARHALDRLDLVAFCLDRKHQARADQTAVDRHAAGATVARAAPLLAAGQMQLVTHPSHRDADTSNLLAQPPYRRKYGMPTRAWCVVSGRLSDELGEHRYELRPCPLTDA